MSSHHDLVLLKARRFLSGMTQEVFYPRYIAPEYDLALSYAQEKLRYALEHGIPDKIYPDKDIYLDELAYLEQQFAIALSEFSTIDEDENLVNALKIRF